MYMCSLICLCLVHQLPRFWVEHNTRSRVAHQSQKALKAFAVGIASEAIIKAATKAKGQVKFAKMNFVTSSLQQRSLRSGRRLPLVFLFFPWLFRLIVVVGGSGSQPLCIHARVRRSVCCQTCHSGCFRIAIATPLQHYCCRISRLRRWQRERRQIMATKRSSNARRYFGAAWWRLLSRSCRRRSYI